MYFEYCDRSSSFITALESLSGNPLTLTISIIGGVLCLCSAGIPSSVQLCDRTFLFEKVNEISEPQLPAKPQKTKYCAVRTPLHSVAVDSPSSTLAKPSAPFTAITGQIAATSRLRGVLGTDQRPAGVRRPRYSAPAMSRNHRQPGRSNHRG